jgi:NTP pyrophosphatase (non-canonical NTP hydrolase)
MTIDEYAKWAATVAQPSLENRVQRLAYFGLGLSGEAGEVADTIRTPMRGAALDEDRLVYELGDLVYHWVCLCTELGHSPATLLDRSRHNIEARLAAREPPTRARHGEPSEVDSARPIPSRAPAP